MDGSANLFSALPFDKMSGGEKFLAVAFHLAEGRIGKTIPLRDVQAKWPQHVLNAPYSPMFYPLSKQNRWVLPNKPAKPVTFVITQAGADHLRSLLSHELAGVQGLMVFGPKNAHTFDKTIRSLFSTATRIDIADSYVDETIFDITLEAIPRSSQIRLLYGQVSPAKQQSVFEARARRFNNEFSLFSTKQLMDFHDRFLIVNGTGYLLGPSLKNAAEKKPALLMPLDHKDSAKLQGFFEELWAHGR